MKLTLVAWLLIGLAVSVLANAFLGWQWAGAKAQCRADMERSARIAIEAERERAGKADKDAGAIAEKTGKETGLAVAAGQGNTNEREVDIRTVVVHGDCRMPARLPRLDSAVREANAAAGD